MSREEFWGRVPRALVRATANKSVPRYALHLYAELASQSVNRRPGRLYFRSIPDLADDLNGITEDAVRAGLHWLHDRGWITWHDRVRTPDGGPRRARPGEQPSAAPEFEVHERPVTEGRGVVWVR